MKTAVLLLASVVYASSADVGPSLSTTNTCNMHLAGLGMACIPTSTGFPDPTTCCPAITTFNEAACFCNPLVVSLGGEGLLNAKAFFQQGCNEVVKEGPACPSGDLGSCQVPANTLDAMRFSSLRQFSASLSFDDGTMDHYLRLYEKLFAENATWALKGTGKYVGPRSILEYARFVDPVINGQIGNTFMLVSSVDGTTLRFYLDDITYTANTQYCFGQQIGTTGISEGGSNCINYVEAGSDYKLTFVPCSAQIAYMDTELSDEAFGGAIGGRNSLYDMCDLIQRECTEDYQVYASTKECYDYMSQRSFTACQDLQFMGDSQSCAWLHSALLLQDKNHCFHVGKEISDSNGEYKCNSKQCEFGFTAEYRANQGLCPSLADDCCTSSEAGCGADEDVLGQTAKCTCAFDPYCCSTAWDAQCKYEAINACGLKCVGSA